MKKEHIKKVFEKRIKVHGNGRYDGFDPKKVNTDFDELKRIREKGISKKGKIFRISFLIFAFVLMIILLLNLFITIP